MTDKSDCPTQVADGERRSIAWSLRDYAADDLGGMSFQKRLAAVCGVKDASWRGTMRRVADLIDRPTCRMRFDAVHQDFVCSACGHWFDSFQTFDGHGKWSDMRYCPNCGARVVEGGAE